MSVHICPPDHKHGGSTTCYQAHGCRCDPCRVLTSTVRRACRVRKAEGRQVAGWRRAGGVCERCGIHAEWRFQTVAFGPVCVDCRDVMKVAA